MKKRNPESPWNPTKPVVISPKEYEKQTVKWLQDSGEKLDNFKVMHLRHLSGAGGDYEFDAVAQFTIFNGAQVTVLIECKRYSRPVEREKILALKSKMDDVKAHKAIIFATCGFQLGALKYAKSYGIATVTFVEGSFLYETKGVETSGSPPSWVEIPKYAGIFIKQNVDCISSSVFGLNDMEILSEWLLL